MRILVVAGQWFPDFTGGTARVVRTTAEGLAQRGHDVIAITPQVSGESAISNENGVEVRRVVRRSLLPLTITDIYEMRRAIQAVPLDRYDLILAHGEASAVAALSARPKRPLVYVFHASSYREAKHRRSLGGVSRLEHIRSLGVEPFLYASERLALRYAARILVLSNFSRRLVLDFEPDAGSRVHVVGGGVDLKVFNPVPDRDSLRQQLGVGTDEKLLMTARRLISRMGVDVLLDAVSNLCEKRNDVRLVIAGDGEMRTSLEVQSGKLGLTDSVNFLGRISDSELLDLYRAADIFVLPTVAYEGFGMVTAEALACGTPVVGTLVGATREVLAPLDEGLLAQGTDAISLVSAIERTMARIDASFRDRCQEYAEGNFGWDVVLERWEAAMWGQA